MKYCPSCLKCYEEALDLCADDASALAESPPDGLVVGGKYRIERLISRGPRVVCEGVQIRTERPVAIKLFLSNADTPERVRQRALTVACISTRVDHQHVVKTCDYGQLPGGVAYVVTELVGGPTLREHLDDHESLPVTEAARVARQIADGLEAAHVCGVVHGGLDPSNVILERDYHGGPVAKVLNFGLSECRSQPPRGGASAAAEGVRPYLSPEQLTGLSADARSDVYSLGVILHEMLTRRTSCARLTEPGTESRQGEGASPQGACCEHVPEPLLTLLSEALNEKPPARLQSAAEFARRLRLVECPAGGCQPQPGAAEPAPPASEGRDHEESADSSQAHAGAPPVTPPHAARPPVRKIGLIDEFADGDLVSHLSPLEKCLGRAEDGPTPVAEAAGAAAATEGRRRLARRDSRTRSRRPGVPTPPSALPPGPTQAHAHRSLAVAVPAILILALGAFGWLSSGDAPPTFNNRDAAETSTASASASLPTKPKPPESAAGGGTTAQAAEGSSTEGGMQEAGSVDTFLRLRDETRKRATSRAPSGVSLNGREAAPVGVSTDAPAEPGAEPGAESGAEPAADPSPGASRPRRVRAERCTITTSKGALTLQKNGSGEIAVGIHGGTAGAITAATSDWSDIVVFAAPPGAGGVSMYRVVSVSGRAGTYHVKFDSPCGARRVPVTVN